MHNGLSKATQASISRSRQCVDVLHRRLQLPPAPEWTPRSAANVTQRPLSLSRPRAAKSVSSSNLRALAQKPLDGLRPLGNENGKAAKYPTVVQEAYDNMQRYQDCVVLTKVGGFYELYFEQARELAPLLNLKLAEKKTVGGPVPMVAAPRLPVW